MDLVWLVAAFSAGIVAKAVRLPTMVGYLAAGVVLALFGVESNTLIQVVADFGVILLLFTVGLHISFRSLLEKRVVGVGAIHLVISTSAFTLVLYALQLPLPAAALIAIGLSFSSTVLTAKSLEARGELDSYHGRLAIGILILQDVVAVLLLAVAGDGAPSWWALALFALPLLRPLLLRLMYAVGHEELLLLYGLLLALGAGWLFELVGLDSKLGALIAGMLLAGDPRSDELYDKLWSLKEVFLVGFFLQVGLAGLPDGRGWLILGMLLLLLPLKGILFFVLMVLFRLRSRTAFLSTVSLTAYSEFALIVVVGAAAVGLIEEQFVVMVGLLVAISFALNAPVSRAVNPLWERLAAGLERFERDVPHPDHEPRTLGSAEYVVLGMGQAGLAAYDYLVGEGRRPLGIDSDPARIRQMLETGRRVLYGDANDPELWTGLDLSRVNGVMLALNNAPAEINAIQNLRDEGFRGYIAALLRYSENKEALQEAGVSVSFLPLAQAGRELAQACLGNEAGSLSRISASDSLYPIQEVKIS
jgi:predicted Kef-type K+ transport protein